AAIDHGRQFHSRILPADIKRTDAFGPVKLVGSYGGEVDVLFLDVHWNFSYRLDRVGVEQDAALAADGADLGDGLQHADLVVGEHDRDQDGLVVERALQVVEIDQPVFAYREVGEAVALFLQMLAAIEHRLVLGDAGDNVITFVSMSFGDALDRQVVALGGTGSDKKNSGCGADQLGHLLPRLLDRRLRLPAELMAAAGGVAELLLEVRQHLVHDAGIERRGGVVVEVDGQLHFLAVHGYGVGRHRRGSRFCNSSSIRALLVSYARFAGSRPFPLSPTA